MGGGEHQGLGARSNGFGTYPRIWFRELSWQKSGGGGGKSELSEKCGVCGSGGPPVPAPLCAWYAACFYGYDMCDSIR